MAIQPVNSGNIANSVAQAKPANKNAVNTQNEPLNPVASDDKVSISQASGNNASPPVVDETRVARIKAAVQSGDYKINPEQVASKMLKFDDLLQANTT